MIEVFKTLAVKLWTMAGLNKHSLEIGLRWWWCKRTSFLLPVREDRVRISVHATSFLLGVGIFLNNSVIEWCLA